MVGEPLNLANISQMRSIHLSLTYLYPRNLDFGLKKTPVIIPKIQSDVSLAPTQWYIVCYECVICFWLYLNSNSQTHVYVQKI